MVCVCVGEKVHMFRVDWMKGGYTHLPKNFLVGSMQMTGVMVKEGGRVQTVIGDQIHPTTHPVSSK